jgi:hypothetical protein
LYAPLLKSGGLSHTSRSQRARRHEQVAETTGRTFAAEMMSIERFAGGWFVKRWAIPDNASVMQQLTTVAVP